MTTDTSLRASAATAQAIALVAIVGLALVARATVPLSSVYLVKAVAAFAVVMLLTLAFVQDHHPFTVFGAANQTTTVRAALVALVAGLVGEPVTPVVAVCAAAAGVVATLLDGVDGWLARRTRMTSAFGARFDMETDAALIQVLAILAWQHGKAGPWVILSGLLRYLFVAAGWCWPWMRQPLPPTERGKVVCVVQIVVLLLVLLPMVVPPGSAVLAALGLVALSYSFMVDTLWLWRTR